TCLALALDRLETRDRERLRLYYIEERTLAEIAKRFGEHESSASRNLDRIRRALREFTEEALSKPAPGPALSAEQIAVCLEYAADDVPIDLGKMLKQDGVTPLQKGKLDA